MSREKDLKNITVWSFIGNFLLLVFKFVAGLWGHSSAMLADAVHSLSDFVTDVVVFICIHLSSRPRDDDHDYGHGKYETLATSVIGVILLFVGVGIFWNGASKIYGFYVLDEPIASPGKIALIAALVSILVKELLFQVTAATVRQLLPMLGIITRMLFRPSQRQSVLRGRFGSETVGRYSILLPPSS